MNNTAPHSILSALTLSFLAIQRERLGNGLVGLLDSFHGLLHLSPLLLGCGTLWLNNGVLTVVHSGGKEGGACSELILKMMQNSYM